MITNGTEEILETCLKMNVDAEDKLENGFINKVKKIENGELSTDIKNDKVLKGEKESVLSREEEENNHIERDKNNTAFCHLCDVTIHQNHSITSHLNGTHHAKSQEILDSLRRNFMSHDYVEYEQIENKETYYFCLLCEKRLYSMVDMEKHLIGKTHTRNLNENPSISFPWDEIQQLECGKKDNILKLSNKKFRCKLCCRDLDLKTVVPHVSGKTHQLALGIIESKKKEKIDPLISCKIWSEIFTAEGGKWSNVCQISSKSFKCIVCSVVLSSDDIVDHVKSDPHQKQASCSENVKRNDILQKCYVEAWQDSSEAERTHEKYLRIETDTRLYCIPCGVVITGSTDNLQCHIHGRPHMETVVKYLLSLPEETKVQSAQEALVKALQRCGMQEYHCMLCDIRFEEESSWQHHLDAQRHIVEDVVTQNCAMCKTKLLGLSGDAEKHNCRNETHRITVIGFSRDTSLHGLYGCFSKFGRVNQIAVTRDMAVVEFSDKSCVERVLAEPPIFRCVKLKVLKVKNPPNGPPVALPLETVHEDMVKVLESRQNFEHKLKKLCQQTLAVSCPQRGHDVCRFLETKLSSLFPGCKAFPFGSRVSGLAFPDSDMDIFLDTGGMYDGNDRQEPEVQELIVSMTENALKDLSSECSRVESIPKARTPIVRFYHNASKTQCDVAFRHGLGVHNTMLISCFLTHLILLNSLADADFVTVFVTIGLSICPVRRMVHPRLITCDDSFQKVMSLCGEMLNFCDKTLLRSKQSSPYTPCMSLWTTNENTTMNFEIPGYKERGLIKKFVGQPSDGAEVSLQDRRPLDVSCLQEVMKYENFEIKLQNLELRVECLNTLDKIYSCDNNSLSKMLDLEDFNHVFGIRGEEEFDRVYQRIQLEEQENRRNIARHRRRCIRFYLSLDERVKPLIVFVKHWAQIHDLVGPIKITNYALTWLVIFYLQQNPDFSLPCVNILQKLHKGHVHRIAGMSQLTSQYENSNL
ncbi:hypothetical protein L9F63_009776 [Diploptera punctata]|uniref:RRM domain-containing protein n=1 Tax=Diploptera punctata TaxID=6984 RepID=A0AAD8ALM8_DIPPU|nr:hypothetical protein L9F63_009776 [Diploptera punctata]